MPMHESHVIQSEVYWTEGADHRYLVRMAFGDIVLTHLVCSTRDEAEALCRKLCKHYGIATQKSTIPQKKVRNASSL